MKKATFLGSHLNMGFTFSGSHKIFVLEYDPGKDFFTPHSLSEKCLNSWILVSNSSSLVVAWRAAPFTSYHANETRWAQYLSLFLVKPFLKKTSDSSRKNYIDLKCRLGTRHSKKNIMRTEGKTIQPYTNIY